MEKSEEDSKKKSKFYHNKLFLISIFILLGVGIVFAAGAFSYNKTIQGTIIGGGVLVVVEDISDFSLNVVDQNVTNIQNLSFFNRDGNKVMFLNLTVNKVSTDPFCTDFINDCSIVFKNSTGVMFNNQPMEFISGFNNFTLETSCVQFTCGQNISIEVDFQ